MANRVRPENEIAVLERSDGNTFSQTPQNGVRVGQEIKLRVRTKIKGPGLRVGKYIPCFIVVVLVF